MKKEITIRFKEEDNYIYEFLDTILGNEKYIKQLILKDMREEGVICSEFLKEELKGDKFRYTIMQWCQVRYCSNCSCDRDDFEDDF